ncbi:hypothetical protein J7337_013922 [Fusarium musae]|uniref:Uncharacterized protein n=1 Tax=Fusarium musae TaxID=1042133 RepID=A0A9P8IIC1_9HYPO|nr:hypothetical protein J7337_013922 [Fusarium musae]KAG9494783.1 hypothetical protein J7337_013922 [Fusarium musae]
MDHLQTRDPVEYQREDTGARLVACEHKSIPTGEDGSKKYSAEMPGTSPKWPFIKELKFPTPMQPPNVHSFKAASYTSSKTLCKPIEQMTKLYTITNPIETDVSISSDAAAETNDRCKMEQWMPFPTHNRFLDH